MNNEKYCPILMIGFDPPKHEKDTDIRICNPGCAWYDDSAEENNCILHTLNTNLLELIDYTCAATIGTIPDYEDF
jgi:hypothetical protein